MYHNIRVILSQCFRTPLTPLKQPRSRDSRPGYTYLFPINIQFSPTQMQFRLIIYTFGHVQPTIHTSPKTLVNTQTFSEKESLINAQPIQKKELKASENGHKKSIMQGRFYQHFRSSQCFQIETHQCGVVKTKRKH